MKIPSFAKLAPGYERLWGELVPSPARVPAIRRIAENIIAHKAAYQAVERGSGAVPWWWIGITDVMEGGGGASHHLHNGDSLARRTVNVPAGRPPPPAAPPFTFYQSALDALRLAGLNGTALWTVAYAAYRWEAFNGWGYLHLPIEDPYLAAWSNKEGAGKFTGDHHFDPNAHSGQPGALTILKILITLDPSIDLSGGAAPKEAPVSSTAAAPATTTTVAPVPAPAAGPSVADVLATVEKGVEGLATVINSPFFGLVAKFIPGAQYAPPFIPIVEKGLQLGEAIAAAPDLPSKLAVLEAHFSDLSALFGQAKAAIMAAQVTK